MSQRIEVSEKLLSRLQNSLARAILVWRFEDAPEEFRRLSQNGGDEDYVVLIPACLCTLSDDKGTPYCYDEYVFEHFDTCNEPQRFVLEDNSIVLIGSHA